MSEYFGWIWNHLEPFWVNLEPFGAILGEFGDNSVQFPAIARRGHAHSHKFQQIPIPRAPPPWLPVDTLWTFFLPPEEPTSETLLGKKAYTKLMNIIKRKPTE